MGEKLIPSIGTSPENKQSTERTLLTEIERQFEATGVQGVRNLLKADKNHEKLSDLLIRELGKKPASWEEHLAWHRKSAILQMIDPQKFVKQESRAAETLQSTLKFIEKQNALGSTNDASDASEDADATFLQLDGRLKMLVAVIALQKTPGAYKTCIEKFSEWERNMNEQHGKDIPHFLESQAKIGRTHERDFFRSVLEKGMRESMEFKLAANPSDEFWSMFKEEDGKFYYACPDENGRPVRWKVEGVEGLFDFRCTEEGMDGLMFAFDPLEKLEELEKNPSKLAEMALNAMRDYKKENGNEQQEILNGYDLPPDKNIGHIRLFPQQKDPRGVVSKGLHTSMLLSSVMQKRYKERFIMRNPVFSDDPATALRSEIQDSLEKNKGKPMHFCIDVFSHGSADRFIFDKKFDAIDIIAIAQEFPECTFTYNTIACYGAGLQKAFEDSNLSEGDPLSSRLAIFTQSKGNVKNLSTTQSTAATMYYVHFMQALNDGKTYGAAHRIADREAKMYLPVDAEAFIDGKKIVMNEPSTTADAMNA